MQRIIENLRGQVANLKLKNAALGGSRAMTSPASSDVTASKCVCFNGADAGNADHAEAETPPETLKFLIEERDKCLQRISDAAADLQFPYYVYHHPPVYTCEEAEKYCPDAQAHIRSHQQSESLNVGAMKNLFLRDKKKNFFLISALDDTKTEMKVLVKKIGAKGGSLSFAKEDKLKELLNLVPGSVTPFGLLNDTAGSVTYFLDELCMVEEYDYLAFHPNACNCTVAMHWRDVCSFIKNDAKHEVNVLPKPAE
jgi:Ala-tRNA(Pro) deacylase